MPKFPKWFFDHDPGPPSPIRDPHNNVIGYNAPGGYAYPTTHAVNSPTKINVDSQGVVRNNVGQVIGHEGPSGITAFNPVNFFHHKK